MVMKKCSAVGEFVGLVQHYQNPLAAFELPYGLAHHVGHRRAAGFCAEALKQLSEELTCG